MLEHVLGMSEAIDKEPPAKCLSAWQGRDLFLLQVVTHCPQYYFAIIKNPEPAV